MSEHTPGPWRHLKHDNMIVSQDGINRLFDIGIQARSLHVSEAERDANAKLAAASPEMLFEMQGIVAFADGFGCYYSDSPAGQELRKWIEGARRAIAKAETVAQMDDPCKPEAK